MLENGIRGVNGRIFFPNVADNLLDQLGLNRFETDPSGEKSISSDYAMFKTSRDDMPFWLFSKMTADRAKVSDFHLIEKDLRKYFQGVDDVNHRDWNATFVNYVPNTSKEVTIFNVFSNAINHVWVENLID
jgi:hypothetical protein